MDGQRVALNVCYEDAFGSEIARQLPAMDLYDDLLQHFGIRLWQDAMAKVEDVAGSPGSLGEDRGLLEAVREREPQGAAAVTRLRRPSSPR